MSLLLLLLLSLLLLSLLLFFVGPDVAELAAVFVGLAAVELAEPVVVDRLLSLLPACSLLLCWAWLLARLLLFLLISLLMLLSLTRSLLLLLGLLLRSVWLSWPGGRRPISWLRRIWPVRRRVYPYYFIIRSISTSSGSQFSCRNVIIPSPCASISNTFVRMLIFVSICINHPGRAGIRRLLHCRAINIHSITVYARNTRPAGIINIVYPYIIISGYLPYFLYTRTAYISHIIFNISVINNSSIMYNSYRAGMGHIVIVYSRTCDVSLRCTYPIIIRYVIPAAY